MRRHAYGGTRAAARAAGVAAALRRHRPQVGAAPRWPRFGCLARRGGRAAAASAFLEGRGARAPSRARQRFLCLGAREQGGARPVDGAGDWPRGDAAAAARGRVLMLCQRPACGGNARARRFGGTHASDRGGLRERLRGGRGGSSWETPRGGSFARPDFWAQVWVAKPFARLSREPPCHPFSCPETGPRGGTTEGTRGEFFLTSRQGVACAAAAPRPRGRFRRGAAAVPRAASGGQPGERESAAVRGTRRALARASVAAAAPRRTPLVFYGRRSVRGALRLPRCRRDTSSSSRDTADRSGAAGTARHET